jgi:predicted small lipoprotein YifL
MKRLTFLMTAISLLFLLSGCGQSGPLFVPGSPSRMTVSPSQASTDEAKDNEQESSEDSSESE